MIADIPKQGSYEKIPCTVSATKQGAPAAEQKFTFYYGDCKAYRHTKPEQGATYDCEPLAGRQVRHRRHRRPMPRANRARQESRHPTDRHHSLQLPRRGSGNDATGICEGDEINLAGYELFQIANANVEPHRFPKASDSKRLVSGQPRYQFGVARKKESTRTKIHRQSGREICDELRTKLIIYDKIERPKPSVSR